MTAKVVAGEMQSESDDVRTQRKGTGRRSSAMQLCSYIGISIKV